VGHVRYRETLDLAGGVYLYVEFDSLGPEVTDYSLVLVVRTQGQIAIVRIYDAAHGFNEMHRFTRRDGKQRGLRFHRGTLGEGMRAAMGSIKSNFQQMIEGWNRR
jgi:hypothetical protein